MRKLMAIFALVISSPALADLAPRPAARNRPYLEALEDRKLSCDYIRERHFIGKAQQPEFKKLGAEIYDITCENGRRYRMIVKVLPSEGRNPNPIRALRIMKR